MIALSGQTEKTMWVTLWHANPSYGSKHYDQLLVKKTLQVPPELAERWQAREDDIYGAAAEEGVDSPMELAKWLKRNGAYYAGPNAHCLYGMTGGKCDPLVMEDFNNGNLVERRYCKGGEIDLIDRYADGLKVETLKAGESATSLPIDLRAVMNEVSRGSAEIILEVYDASENVLSESFYSDGKRYQHDVYTEQGAVKQFFSPDVVHESYWDGENNETERWVWVGGKLANRRVYRDREGNPFVSDNGIPISVRHHIEETPLYSRNPSEAGRATALVVNVSFHPVAAPEQGETSLWGIERASYVADARTGRLSLSSLAVKPRDIIDRDQVTVLMSSLNCGLSPDLRADDLIDEGEEKEKEKEKENDASDRIRAAEEISAAWRDDGSQDEDEDENDGGFDFPDQPQHWITRWITRMQLAVAARLPDRERYMPSQIVASPDKGEKNANPDGTGTKSNQTHGCGEGDNQAPNKENPDQAAKPAIIILDPTLGEADAHLGGICATLEKVQEERPASPFYDSRVKVVFELPELANIGIRGRVKFERDGHKPPSLAIDGPVAKQTEERWQIFAKAARQLALHPEGVKKEALVPGTRELFGFRSQGYTWGDVERIVGIMQEKATQGFDRPAPG